MTLNHLQADTHRRYGHFTWASLVKGLLFSRTFRPVVTMRLCQIAYRSAGLGRLLLLPFKVLHHVATHRAGMDFSWQIQAGPGLAITHGWGMVANAKVQIGSNVTLFHGVTLGQRDHIAQNGTRHSEYPVIEDEVWIGPHAIIVGGITIGRGSRIAGGSFITADVPPYSVVAGNPASVVKTQCVPDVPNLAPV